MERIQQASLRLLTSDQSGHTLNKRQVLSPDGLWLIFDSRNEDSKISTSDTISRVSIVTGEIQTLYKTAQRSTFGPGVAAAAYHPTQHQFVCLHGLESCCQDRPYGIARRFGAWFEIGQSPSYRILESRRMSSPLRWGELSGGTHAHSWSPSGTRVSFTYNDALVDTRPRTIGFASLLVRFSVGQVPNINLADALSARNDGEQFQGYCAAFLAVNTDGTQSFVDVAGISNSSASRRERGILQAVEECWVSDDEMAFLGTIQTDREEMPRIQEIFIVTLPSDAQLIEHSRGLESNWPSQKAGSNPMNEGVEQQGMCATGELQVDVPNLVSDATHFENHFPIRRLSHSLERLYPGVQGPRNWLVSDGKWIYTLVRDDRSVVQAARIAKDSQDGKFEFLTSLSSSIEGQLALNNSRSHLSFVANGKIHVLNLDRRVTTILDVTSWFGADGRVLESEVYTDDTNSGCGWNVNTFVGAPHFLNDGRIAVNRYIRCGENWWLQIGIVQCAGSY